MVLSVALLALFSILGGIFINFPAAFVESIVSNLPGLAR
jgi:hypothetical protein